jgi:hypothetical protein
MQNVFTREHDRKKVFGVAAADKLTHDLLYNFIDRVAHAFPNLTFEVWHARRVDVSDVYGHEVGRVEIDFIGQYNRMVLKLSSPRMTDKRGRKAKTADLNKAVKMFAKYFRSNTDEELMGTYFNRFRNVTGHAYNQTLGKLRNVMEEPLYNFFQTSTREKRYELYSLLALPEDKLSAIEAQALQYFDHCTLLNMSECAVLLKTPTGYLVKRSTPEGIVDAPVERVEEVPPEYRAQVGLLKLASHREFIPNVGVKLSDSTVAVESYLCVNRNTTC